MVVAAGGFAEAATVKSSNPDLEVSSLRTNHEEADIWLILHCIHAHMETIVPAVRDTDVLLLLLALYHTDLIGLKIDKGPRGLSLKTLLHQQRN